LETILDVLDFVHFALLLDEDDGVLAVQEDVRVDSFEKFIVALVPDLAIFFVVEIWVFFLKLGQYVADFEASIDILIEFKNFIRYR